MRPRDNPFRADRLDGLRYRLPEAGWAELMARLEVLGRRAAVVGPEGSGKTTLLEELGARLQRHGSPVRMVRLTKRQRRLPAGCLDGLAEDAVLLVDGADELSRLSWWSLRRGSKRHSGLVITAHREGMLPTLRTCSTSRALLADLVGELLGADGAASLQPRLAALFDAHRGDLRSALRRLYDVWPTVCNENRGDGGPDVTRKG